VLQPLLKKYKLAGEARIRIHNATEVVTMDDPIEVALRRKKDSSMRVAVTWSRRMPMPPSRPATPAP
jgi:glycerol-3-phosphate acyltransferase PlsX